VAVATDHRDAVAVGSDRHAQQTPFDALAENLYLSVTLQRPDAERTVEAGADQLLDLRVERDARDLVRVSL